MSTAAAKWAAAICLSVWLCACGGMDRVATQPGQTTTDDAQPQTYYAGYEGLPLYPQPGFSGSPLARLPLNEKVMRSRVQQGFAYVTVARNGSKGWVENAKLTWKKTAQPVTAPAAPTVTAPSAAASPTAGKDREGRQSRSPSKPDASIFDAN